MAHAASRASCVLATASALFLGLTLCGESWAGENTSRGIVLQSGHVGGDAWRRSPVSHGLALSFEDRAAVLSAARQELRRIVRQQMDKHSLSLSGLFPGLASSLSTGAPTFPGTAVVETFSEGLRESRTLAALGLDLRPRTSFNADLDEAEALLGLRLQWTRGLARPAEAPWLRAVVYADWEGRAGLENLFSGPVTTGSHDLDAGLGLTVGDWNLSLEANLAASGFGDHAGHGAAGSLGYAVQF